MFAQHSPHTYKCQLYPFSDVLLVFLKRTRLALGLETIDSRAALLLDTEAAKTRPSLSCAFLPNHSQYHKGFSENFSPINVSAKRILTETFVQWSYFKIDKCYTQTVLHYRSFILIAKLTDKICHFSMDSSRYSIQVRAPPQQMRVVFSVYFQFTVAFRYPRLS